MIFYTATEPDTGRTRIVGTQADAREVNRDFEQIDVPTSKAELMAYVQGLLDQIHELQTSVPVAEDVSHLEGEPDGSGAAEEGSTPSLPPPVMQTDSVEEQILAAEGADFARILQATIERLGEVRKAGWDGLRALMSNNPQSRTSLERGLGYLLIEA